MCEGEAWKKRREGEEGGGGGGGGGEKVREGRGKVIHRSVNIFLLVVSLTFSSLWSGKFACWNMLLFWLTQSGLDVASPLDTFYMWQHLTYSIHIYIQQLQQPFTCANMYSLSSTNVFFMKLPKLGSNMTALELVSDTFLTTNSLDSLTAGGERERGRERENRVIFEWSCRRTRLAYLWHSSQNKQLRVLQFLA